MAFAPIPEYEGKSPYVFITYAQQDEKIAYSIAVKMYNEGFRIWSSAACGNPSNMRIAERLGNAEVAMVFLSRSYLKYASYKEFEPRAVMNSPKKKIVVCLDDTPLGVEWNTVDFPAGIRYNPDIPQELWLRINSSDTLEKCRGAWPKNPMPLPFEESRAINISVDEEELSDELSSLNSVMASFGAGLDEQEVQNITLFQRDDRGKNQFKWPERQTEQSQEQEYYNIENLIDNSPMPVNPENNQYHNMVGLIESFMEKSSRAKEEELQKILSEPKEEPIPEPPQSPLPENPYGYRPIPKNEFDKVDLSKDIASHPVVITESSAINAGMKPIVIDYGDDSEVESYSMTRRSARSGRNVSEPPAPIVAEEPPAPISLEKKEEKQPEMTETTFEKVVDDRTLITSTEDNVSDARLTYHLGALDAFDESNYVQDAPEPQPEPVQELPPFEPVVRFKGEDIPQPALSFDKPRNLNPLPLPAPEPPQEHKRSIVSVRTRVRRTEYESEMYEVNGRWIPGEIYHRLMPNAKYTMVRRVSRPQTVELVAIEPAPTPIPAPAPLPTRRASRPELNSESRLFGAVNTFFTPQPPRTTAESIPEPLRSAMRERHEMRRSEAIRQYEEEAAQIENVRSSYNNGYATYSNYYGGYNGYKNPVPPDEENTPARKHKFSHEGGIKKSLMANMETPVDTSDAEESHRQYGARAEIAAANENKSSIKEPEVQAPPPEKPSKKKDEEKAAKKAAQKAAEKAARKEAQKKAARKKAEEEKKEKEKKKKQSKAAKEQERPASTQTAGLSRRPPLQRTAPSVFPDVDEDSFIELPGRNLPKINYDPEAYRDMNLSEILFGESGDKKNGKKDSKKKKRK